MSGAQRQPQQRAEVAALDALASGHLAYADVAAFIQQALVAERAGERPQ